MASNPNAKKEHLEIALEFIYHPWLYLVDLAIRSVIVYLYIQWNFSTWIFFIAQFALFGINISLNEKYIEKLKKKYTPLINPAYKKEIIKISISESIPNALMSMQAICGFAFSWWFFYHITTNHEWYMNIIFFILSFIGTGMFIGNLSLTVRYKESKGITSLKVEKVTQSTENNSALLLNRVDLTKQYSDILLIENENNNSTYIIELDSVDYNDTQIAKLESELKSINHRVEAYMLESVFLGGLSFSGFLTVAAANFLGKETQAFKEFLMHIEEFLNKCSNEHFTLWFQEIQNYFFRNDLYILIMVLCLMASVFFLLVLTLRLRLTSLSLNMDHLIRIMTIFNAKEEELFNLQFQNGLRGNQNDRLNKIGKKIDIALTDANKLLKELKPTVTMMSIYRNLALFLFYSVLIVSGFYFMPIVATTIFVLAIFTQIFRIFETYSKVGKIRELIRKH